MYEINLPKGLVVSCQAYEGDPFFGSQYMAAMAKAAEAGGAIGIRANSPKDIEAIRQSTSLPIIGIYKINSPDSEVYITPDFEVAKSIAEAGADIIAIDATPRKRPQGIKLADLIDFIRNKLKKIVMGDISCLDDALIAASLKVDILSTTLAGYTSHGRPLTEGPDLELVKQLVNHLDIPVFAEGRFRNSQEAVKAIKIGAHAVVIGESITRPNKITERFCKAISLAISNE